METHPPAIFTIPPNLSFLDSLAATALAQAGPLDGGWSTTLTASLFLLPTRRAARALAEAFLRQSGGRPLLLPRIIALGGPDEAGLALTAALDLPQAVPAPLRATILARMILAMSGAQGAPTAPDQAYTLALSLAALLDEAAFAEIDLAHALPNATGGEYAEHWQKTLKFLDIITNVWPNWLADNHFMDIGARNTALLRAQSAAWRKNPPTTPIIAAGITGAVPAAANLLATIATLPQGQIILPGFDTELNDPTRAALDLTHPQTAMHALLAAIGAGAGDVQIYPALTLPATAPASRVTLLRQALFPAARLPQWQTARREKPKNLELLTARDQQHEAVAIALALREAIEKPGTTAALVTQDRALAQRVSAELLRFDVIADDSAGEPLVQTPVFVFLRLLLEAIDLRPIHLLALLKHPYAAFGLSSAECRRQARILEIRALRGPKPTASFNALRARHGDPDFLARLEKILSPLRASTSLVAAETLLKTLLETAEQAASTDTAKGCEILWSGEDGEAFAAHLSELFHAFPHLPPLRARDLAPLLVASASHIAVRSQRALRGRLGALHPRIFIWGVLEARLQTADLIVLGGLSEGIWPGLADPGPWVNREMRTRIGLPSPEESIGAESLDFALLTCAAPRVILSAPQKRDGAPAVPARWLARLTAFLGTNFALDPASCAVWANDIDHPPLGDTQLKTEPPKPCPALAYRPRKLSVTEIETLVIDPYAIHARHILKLKALDPIEEPADASDYGTLVHEALAKFAQLHGPNPRANAAAALREVFVQTLDENVQSAKLRPALAAWWRPRLLRIADWIATEAEPGWRAGIPLSAQFTEKPASWEIGGLAQNFTLTARADRIDQRQSDHQISILDYKTGQPPAQKAVAAFYAPQLPLEAVMLAHGAFGELHGTVTRLAYWRITGGHPAGEQTILFKAQPQETADVIAHTETRLRRLIARYDNPAEVYAARPIPGKFPRFSDYTKLERVALWAGAEEDTEE